MRSVTRINGALFAQGTRVLVRQPKIPPALWTVTEIVEGRSFTWVSGAPLIRAVARHEVERIEDGSRATLAVEFSGPLAGLVARITRKLNNEYLALEAQGLKQRSLAQP